MPIGGWDFSTELEKESDISEQKDSDLKEAKKE